MLFEISPKPNVLKFWTKLGKSFPGTKQILNIDKLNREVVDPIRRRGRRKFMKKKNVWSKR